MVPDAVSRYKPIVVDTTVFRKSAGSTHRTAPKASWMKTPATAIAQRFIFICNTISVIYRAVQDGSAG